jgi:hypothetical protein
VEGRPWRLGRGDAGGWQELEEVDERVLGCVGSSYAGWAQRPNGPGELR